MSTPEDAIEQARARAAEIREATDAEPARPPSVGWPKLLEWAVIEPDVSEVRSTRRYGAPVTALKQGLMRLLAQYHAVLTAQQTRFNINLLARVRQLEERVEELERERR
jgi:hypothetical protein